MRHVVKVLVLCSCAISGPKTTAFLLSSVSQGAGLGLGRYVQPLTMLGPTSPDVRIQKDVVVIGGGLAGLSTALELAKRGRQVTVVSRSREEAAAEAAGGMIAPQAERLESGPYLDLCLSSRAMYAEWVRSIEAIAGMGGAEPKGKGGEGAETHFWSSGGFMSPAFEGDVVHTWSPPPEGGQAHWIGRDQALEMEPSISRDIVGAWWYPQDMSIDAQRMFRVLEQACSKGGVEILQGMAAASLVYDTKGTSVDAVVLEDGRRFHANAIVSATGAWMRELMPVPMVPHKGQMMSLREPEGGRGAGAPKQGGGIGLTRVFFAEGCYIIPKRDGRIVVGSTVEVGEYGLHNTPAGMKQIIDAAVKVCPALADLAIERTWAGLRPVTPDTFPVLGASHRCPNLFVAGGYWRNGVLLAPKTAQLVADAVCGCPSSEDDYFLQEFSMDRFTSFGTPAAAAAAAAAAGTEAAAAQTPPPAQAGSGRGTSTETGAERFVSDTSRAEILEMERAALEGVNDGDIMLSALEGMFGKGMVEVEREDAEAKETREEAAYVPAPDGEGAVNEYHASEEFSEKRLKDARMANRLLQDGSDARLEAMFGDGPGDGEGGGEVLPDSIGQVNSWDDGAAEVANMIGAELVEMEVDIPEGMTVEEALDQQGPMMKVLWESPSGEDIEVPRGMNVASMVEAGLIAPFDQEIDGGEGLPSGVTGARAGAGKPPSGVFDPAAVKGAQERSTEVSELYAKVMANKARAKAPSTASQNGYNGSGVKGEINGSNAWLSGVLGKGQGRGQGSGSSEKPAARTMTARSGHQHGQGGKSADEDEDADPAGMGVATASGEGNGNNEDNENTDGGKEMVGYDFILKDRADTEGKVAQSARASVRSAPEGEEEWANYEKIANEAMASMGGMETVEYLPP